MVKKYGSKRDKAVADKGQAAREGQSVQETERMMDIELFLEGQTKWEEDSPTSWSCFMRCFKHAANKGQKELEQTVCQGCRQELPKLENHPTQRTRASRGGGVLLQRVPRAEGREDIWCHHEAPIC